MADTEKKLIKINIDDQVKLKGKYIYSVGRRKTSAAQIRLYKNGNGSMMVNNLKANQYFKKIDLFSIINQPLKQTGLIKDFNFTIKVSGGGKKSQAEAVRHGISRALIEVNRELRPSLKARGWIMRDASKKERKKPGLKKARRAPQWAKR